MKSASTVKRSIVGRTMSSAPSTSIIIQPNCRKLCSAKMLESCLIGTACMQHEPFLFGILLRSFVVLTTCHPFHAAHPDLPAVWGIECIKYFIVARWSDHRVYVLACRPVFLQEFETDWTSFDANSCPTQLQFKKQQVAQILSISGANFKKVSRKGCRRRGSTVAQFCFRSVPGAIHGSISAAFDVN